MFPHPARQEGRYGQSSPDAARDAMDAVRARRSADRGRRNRVVPIPRRWDQAWCDERKATVARKPGAPRRSRISRNPLRGECRLFRLNLCCLRAQNAQFFARKARGCGQHPVFPAPSLSRVSDDANLGYFHAAGRLNLVSLAVIARLDGRSSIPEAVVIESRRRGILDAPVKPGHDSGVIVVENATPRPPSPGARGRSAPARRSGRGRARIFRRAW